MWDRIFEWLGRGYRDRRRADAAQRALESAYPELEATDVWLRAHESDRDVVAVLYRQRGSKLISRGRPPYKLFAIRPDLVVEEVPDDPSSRYAIRGIK